MMMEMSTLVTLRKVLSEVIRKDDCGCTSIDELEKLRTLVDCQIRERSIRDFFKHVDDSMPFADDPDESTKWDEFTQMTWTIGFNGKMVTIDNCAQVYQGVYDMLKEYISEMYDEQ